MPAVVAAISAAADAASTIVNFFNTCIPSVVIICSCYASVRDLAKPSMLVLLVSAVPGRNTRRGCCLRPKTLGKARLRPRQMLAHRRARGVGIVGCDGIADRLMFGQRRAPGLRILEIMC